MNKTTSTDSHLTLNVGHYLKVIQDRDRPIYNKIFLESPIQKIDIITFETDPWRHIYNVHYFCRYVDALSSIVNRYGSSCHFQNNNDELHFIYGSDIGYYSINVVLSHHHKLKTCYNLFPTIEFKNKGAISFNQVNWPQ